MPGLADLGTILITGSNGGIGSHISQYLLKAGFRRVICQYRTSNEKISSILKENDLKPEDHLFKADLADERAVQDMVKFASKDKPLWAVLNVAGASTSSMSWKIPKADFEKVITDNLMTTFLVSRECAAQLRTTSGGRIINFSSVVAQVGTIGAAHYCAAKAGIEGLSRAMALELAPKKITVNAVALGYFEYGLIKDVPEEMLSKIKQNIPMNRLGNEEDLGCAINFLLHPSSNYYTGQVLNLSGGQRL